MQHDFDTQQDCLDNIVGNISTLLRNAIERTGGAGLAVSGGRSPVPLFEQLSLEDLPWEKIHVTLVDERFVPPDHPDSNELLVRSHLLKNRAEHARFKFALLTQGWLGNGPGASLLAKQLRYIDAMKILLTDEPFDAQEALRIGLINEVVPHAQLLARAEKIARHICTLPPVAVRMMKEFVVRFGDLPTDQAWHVQNLINHLLIQTTMDGEEGRRAFNEKRPQDFSGKLRKRGDAWPDLSEEDAKRLDDVYRSGEF